MLLYNQVKGKQLLKEENKMMKEREFIKTLQFDDNGIAVTETITGKRAIIEQNNMNIYRPLYALRVDGKTVFTRGTISTVFNKINQL